MLISVADSLLALWHPASGMIDPAAPLFGVVGFKRKIGCSRNVRKGIDKVAATINYTCEGMAGIKQSAEFSGDLLMIIEKKT